MDIIYLIMGMNILENGVKIKKKDLVFIISKKKMKKKLNISIQVNLKIIINLEKDYISKLKNLKKKKKIRKI